MRLYHVTPQENLEDIQGRGVSTEFASGKKRVSWWVEMTYLAWALAHVSKVHGISTGDCVVFFIDTEDYRQVRFVRHPTPGVYLCRSTVHASKWFHADEFFEAYMSKFEE